MVQTGESHSFNEKSIGATRNVSGFDFQGLNHTFVTQMSGQVRNRAAAYGVRIVPAQPARARSTGKWRASTI